MTTDTASAAPDPSTLVIAAALALAAAVSLGLARFSYALLLPPMRADLDWSYLTAGAMNTVNAAGYLGGALLLPRVLQRFDVRTVLLAGSAAAGVLLCLHGVVEGDAALYALRLLTGVASAAAFVGGGLLAARLATTSDDDGSADRAAGAGSRTHRSGLVLGIYYGGTGLGIVISALLVGPIAGRAVAHAWQAAWIALGVVALLATLAMRAPTRHLALAQSDVAPSTRFRWTPLRFALAGYFMFGLGYIGYMTFVITLLREQRMDAAAIVGFYVVLGLGVIASSWLWAGLLQRCRGGAALALLNGLLAVATALPVLSAHPLAVFVSGALFGSVFLSVVASTTALVRHNLPPAAWAGGIGAFTIVFAAGQIVGPSLVGWVADGPGGLVRGFVVSAGVLLAGAALAWRQRALADTPA
jgi:predicted MFS family arabinose efflux permease